MRSKPLVSFALACGALAGGCAAPGATLSAAPRVRYAIAIHGGSGVIEQGRMTPLQQAEYVASLRAALELGRQTLAQDGTALDACERVIRFLEDDPKFNAGRGAAFTDTATHELDAAIMEGATLRAGAVAGVRTVKHPVSLARLVMERTRHILLAADGAEAFADEMGVERVPTTYFDTPERRKLLDEVLEERRKEQERPSGARSQLPVSAAAAHGTVGCVALDSAGNLAAATSTGGLTGKKWGRIGDSPIIGAGTYANNAACAVSCTGTGEQFMRHCAARDVAALMQYRGLSARAAAEEVIFRRLDLDDGGMIVLARTGEIALVFNTEGMYRGAADSTGRFEVGIWKELER